MDMAYAEKKFIRSVINFDFKTVFNLLKNGLDANIPLDKFSDYPLYGNRTALHYWAGCVEGAIRIENKDEDEKRNIFFKKQWMSYNDILPLKVKTLLSCADPNIQDINGNTPMHCAIYNMHKEIAYILMNCISVELFIETAMIRNNYGKTVSKLAKEKGIIDLFDDIEHLFNISKT